MGFPGLLGCGEPVSHLAATGPAVDSIDDAVDASGGMPKFPSAGHQAVVKAHRLSVLLVELDTFTEEPVEVLDGFQALLLGNGLGATTDLTEDVLGLLLGDVGEAVFGCEGLDTGHGVGGSVGEGSGGSEGGEFEHDGLFLF